MKKRLLILTIVCALAAAYLAGDIIRWLRVDESVPRENIVSEAIARQAITPGKAIDVSDIVNRYITIGEKRTEVVRHLTALDFEIRFQLMEIDGIEALIATRYPVERTLGNYTPFPIPFSDRLEITVYFDAHVVRNASGKILYPTSQVAPPKQSRL